MKKKNIFLYLLFIIIFIFVSCEKPEEDNDSYMLSLKFLGDISEPLALNNLNNFEDISLIEHRGNKIQAIKLEKLINTLQPHTEKFEILFNSYDDFSVIINNDNLEESYLSWNNKNGWESINKNHPVSSNIKNIKEIIIISSNPSLENNFNIIQPGKNLMSLSVGQMYKDGYSLISTFRGKSTFNSNGQDLEAITFYLNKKVDFEKYISFNNRNRILLIGNKGEVELLSQNGIFILGKNNINYMIGNDLTIENVKGLVFNAPEKLITNVYKDTKELLLKEERVLLILIDGLGYHQYEYAKNNEYISFLDSLPEPERIISAFPPVTPVNFSASLTGELPHINGVYQRGIRQTHLPTIFDFCKENKKESAAVIGPINTIELEISPVFSLDLNNDGSTDDEKTKNALNLFSNNYDLIFVHYKDVDIAGHNFGDFDKKTFEEIKKIDGYVKKLVENWDGRVIIYSDHGMHKTDDGGSHGILTHEDMFTPYWIF